MITISSPQLPRYWRILSYLLSLYRDVNNTLHAISKGDIEETTKNLRRIIGKLRAINTLGHAISWFFFLHLPMNLFMADEKTINIQKIRAFLIDLRAALEKMIISRGRFKLIRQKDVYVDLRNPLISLGVPEKFENMIPGFEYLAGSKPVILSAAHAAPPSADKLTGDLAKIVARRSGAHAIISTIPRIFIDPNRIIGRLSPYRRFMENIIKTHRIKLVIDLHSMRVRSENIVEIGTWYGLSISSKLLDKLFLILEKHEIPYALSTRFYGGDIIFYHSKRPIINTIQIEIANNITKRDYRRLIRALVKFINQIGGKNKYKRAGRKT